MNAHDIERLINLVGDMPVRHTIGRFDAAFCFQMDGNQKWYTQPYPDAVWSLMKYLKKNEKFLKKYNENHNALNQFRHLYVARADVDEFEGEALRIDTIKFLWQKLPLNDRVRILERSRPNYSKKTLKEDADFPPIPLDKILTWTRLNLHNPSTFESYPERLKYTSVPQYLAGNGYKILKIWDKDVLK